MTREEAIYRLNALSMMCEYKDAYGDYVDTEPYDTAIDMAIEALEEQQWIPCSERLPACGEDVLLSISGGCNVGHIVPTNDEVQYNWYFSGWYHLPNDVDAWMPLPKPYRKEKE